MTFVRSSSNQHLMHNQNMFTQQFVPDVTEQTRRLSPLTPNRNNQSRRRSIFSKNDKDNGHSRERSLPRECSVGAKDILENRSKHKISPGPKPIQNPQGVNHATMNRIILQFEQSLTFMQSSMNEQIAQNHELILKLQSNLKNNEQLLRHRNIEINILKSRIDALTRPKDGQNPNFSQDYEHITSRLRDVEIKIWNVSKQMEGFTSQKLQSMLSRLESKMKRVQTEILVDMKGKIKQIVEKTMIRYDSNNNRISRIETQLNQLELAHEESKNRRAEKYKNAEMEISISMKQLGTVRELMNSYSDKVFKYDNYEIKDLRARIEAMVSTISEFETKKSEINQYLKQVQQQNVQLVNLLNHQYQGQRLKAGTNLAGTIKSKKYSRVTKYVIPEGLAATKNSEGSNSQDNTFNIFDSQDEYEVFQNSDMEEGEEGDNGQTKEKLIETIRKMGNTTPVPCSIDQSGYLKYKKLDTYVFDVQGNLFQLSKRQIRQAVEQRIISLT